MADVPQIGADTVPAQSSPERRPESRMTAAPRHLQELLALAGDLAYDAGQVHVNGLRSALRVETKSTKSDLVSQVDREAERLIVDRLREVRPDDALLAEEGSQKSGTTGVRWVIDPLDGTTNYVYGYPAFAVSIAVEIEGEPRIGVVFDSSAGHMYRALDGFGAVCDDRPLRVGEPPDISNALVATGFSYEAAQRERQGLIVARIVGRVRDIRRGGSAALDLCRVAAGHVDAYWELGLSPWDYAAGGVIAREAGADVRFLAAANRKGPAVVAAPPTLMPDFLSLLSETGALTPS